MSRRTFKVKKKLNGPQNYRKWSDYAIGDLILGTFVGIHEDKKYGKEHFKMKVMDAQFKDGTGDEFEDKILVLNACGSLSKAMDGVEEGQVFQVEYLGMAEMEAGNYAGKEAHSVEVSIMEEDDTEGVEAQDESDSL